MKKRVFTLILCVILTFSLGAASVFACNDHGCGYYRGEKKDIEWPGCKDWDCPDWDWDCEKCDLDVNAEDAVYDTLPHGGEIIADKKVKTSPLYYVGVEGTSYGPSTEAPVEVGTYVAYAYGCFTMAYDKFRITPATVKFTLYDQEIWSGETIDDVWYENYYAEGFLGDIVDFDPASLKDRKFTEDDVKIVVVDKDGKIVTDYSAPGEYILRVIPKFTNGAYNRNYQILESKIFDGKLIVKASPAPITGDSANLGVWAAAMAVCMAGAAVLFLKKRA